MNRYTYLWEFLVAPQHVEAFQREYGPDGAWVALFQRAPGFIETLLLRDAANPLRFITVDRWQSAEAYRAFRSSFAAAYAQLDERCAHLTTRETSLGHYEEAIA